jgi:CheY-like chemotaxis protein
MQQWTTAMGYNILVVDDSKLARMVVTSSLRRLRPDWTITEASSGDEAIAAVQKGGIRVALIDFNMPDMDGLALIAKLRQIDADMPIAVVSANLQHEIITRARELNAAFVGKPLTDEALSAFLTGATLRLKKTQT